MISMRKITWIWLPDAELIFCRSLATQNVTKTSAIIKWHAIHFETELVYINIVRPWFVNLFCIWMIIQNKVFFLEPAIFQYIPHVVYLMVIHLPIHENCRFSELSIFVLLSFYIQTINKTFLRQGGRSWKSWRVSWIHVSFLNNASLMA